MPSPVAHVGLALAVYAATPRPWRARDAALIAAASIAPDLDLVPDLLAGDGIHWHHGASHSLLGALMISAALVAGFRPARPVALCVLAALLLHAPLDYTTGEPGAPAKYGVEWLWPLSGQRFISPDPWFGAYHIDRDGGLLHMFVAEALPCYLRELATVAAALLVGLAAGRARRATSRPARSPGP